MKKYLCLAIASSLFIASLLYGAGRETFGAKEEGKTGLPRMVAKLNTNFAALMDMTSQQRTNSQSLTISTGGIFKVFPLDAGATTCTNTLPNAAYAGQLVVLLIDPLATNSMVIAKSGNYAGPAITLAPGEASVIVANKAGGTNAWSGIIQ